MRKRMRIARWFALGAALLLTGFTTGHAQTAAGDVDHRERAGGFGSAVLEAWSRLPAPRARVRPIDIPDRFVAHMSSRGEQLAAAGLDADGLERVVRGLSQGAAQRGAPS